MFLQNLKSVALSVPEIIGRGVATGGPQKSDQVNFLWGKITPERLFNSFIPPQKKLYPQNKFLATPLIIGGIPKNGYSWIRPRSFLQNFNRLLFGLSL